MRYSFAIGLAVGAMLFSPGDSAKAAEAATGVYLLGSRGPMAGYTPPAGIYFNEDSYFYSGKIGGGRSLPLGGLLVANVSATSWINQHAQKGKSCRSIWRVRENPDDGSKVATNTRSDDARRNRSGAGCRES